MKEVSRLLSLQQLTTTPYHPMCNGLVERFHATLKVYVNEVVNLYHANMLKQYVERQNMASHRLMSAETTTSVNEDDDTEGFLLDDCAFPMARQPDSYNDVSISDTFTSGQRSEVETLIEQYPEVLSSLPGRTDQIQHDIKLLPSEPIRSKGNPIPYKTRDVMEAEIQEMIDLDVTEPSISPYSSPVVLVPKKDDWVRFCMNIRKVNKVMQNQCQIWKKS